MDVTSWIDMWIRCKDTCEAGIKLSVGIRDHLNASERMIRTPSNGQERKEMI